MKLITFAAVLVIAFVALADANCPSKVSRTNCREARDVGSRRGNNCRARAGRVWWYDARNRECKQMNYLGCGGNGNRYCTKELCERACRGSNCPGQIDRTNCRDPRNEGRRGRNCSTRAGRMWYYDSRSRDCKQMNYLGCGGNGNRYCTKELCERACRRRT